MENHYLYYLRNPINLIVFYVGVAKITTHCPLGYRPKHHIKESINYRDNNKLSKGANLHKIRTIINILNNNELPIIEIVLINISQEEVLREEVNHIKTIGRRDLGTGPLTNLTDGGIGGFNMSKDGRRRVSESRKGRPSPSKGRILGPYSDERKRAAAEGIRKRNATGIPRIKHKEKAPVTKEHRENLSKAGMGRVSTRKGKTYEEFYGEEKANILKEKISKNSNILIKGKTFEQFHGLEKASELKDNLRNQKSPSKGKTYEEMFGLEKAADLKARRSVSSIKLWQRKKNKPLPVSKI